MEPKTLRAVADWLEGRYARVDSVLLRVIANGLEAAHGGEEEPEVCPCCGGPAVTHYGVIHSYGDFDGEHPNPELRGSAPHLELIAGGDEEFCWQALVEWTTENPLQQWEQAEVLSRTSVHPRSRS